ncbi:hypothetical protein RN001_001065 [Aquatica leii]|uniref:KxDL domain-containing protein n=1 Tax=Aquatica leii TaxID=1421715 RepID=A0AAN7Q3N2_9COLE|nr:hypothetical protein RN001_001065 [Aquatica leii]
MSIVAWILRFTSNSRKHNNSMRLTGTLTVSKYIDTKIWTKAKQDVETMIRAQKQMLQRFEKTNEMLTNCNALSASRLKAVAPEFKKHTQLLQDMKKDLDYIFKKIRAIKAKLTTQYPDALAEAQRSSLAEECEEDQLPDQICESKEQSNAVNETSSMSK